VELTIVNIAALSKVNMLLFSDSGENLCGSLARGRRPDQGTHEVLCPRSTRINRTHFNFFSVRSWRATAAVRCRVSVRAGLAKDRGLIVPNGKGPRMWGYRDAWKELEVIVRPPAACTLRMLTERACP